MRYLATRYRATVITVTRLYHGQVLVLHHIPLHVRRNRLLLLLLLLPLLLLLFFIFMVFLLLLLLMVVVMVMVVRVVLMLVLVLLHFVGARIVWSQVQRFLSLAQRLS